MKQPAVKRARNVRKEKVEEDHSRVGEAQKKELMLAYVEDRKSYSKRAKSSAEEDQDVDGVQSESSSSVSEVKPVKKMKAGNMVTMTS
ncbi:hypothetical protein Syun_014641 [Stephania yunnanensis]|uniref:Uncharacterized protein n=1 Tax=Stephania yunnanensis TaxID=152371 RepID=A0AAP0PC47_9MAGN